VRLIFEYDGDAVRLVSQQPVEVAIPGPDFVQVHAAGTFVDARDSADRTLARVHARGMSEGALEVFPEKPGEPIVHVKVERPQGAFTVVLPVPQAAKRVTVVRVAARLEAPGAAAPARAPGAFAAEPAFETRELGTFPLQR
jgi:hypothetical protein